MGMVVGQEQFRTQSAPEEEAERPASGVMIAAKCLTGDRAVMKPLLEQVTLVVYGWRNVQPGTLAWVFPSLGAAVAAAHAMRNAVQWMIVRGAKPDAPVDVEAERATGSVLVEQSE